MSATAYSSPARSGRPCRQNFGPDRRLSEPKRLARSSTFPIDCSGMSIFTPQRRCPHDRRDLRVRNARRNVFPDIRRSFGDITADRGKNRRISQRLRGLLDLRFRRFNSGLGTRNSGLCRIDLQPVPYLSPGSRPPHLNGPRPTVRANCLAAICAGRKCFREYRRFRSKRSARRNSFSANSSWAVIDFTCEKSLISKFCPSTTPSLTCVCRKFATAWSTLASACFTAFFCCSTCACD